MSNFILPLAQVSKNDTASCGGKGANLGELMKIGMPVPIGFVITTQAYREFRNRELTPEAKEEILKAFDELGAERVAVRSSAVAEDSSKASWAGQLETFLNFPKEELIDKIRECWNSIRSERALAYAAQQGLAQDELEVAVVVQKMLDAQVSASGVVFTVHPVTKDKNHLVIEAVWGLGELIVQGFVTPDTYVVDKKMLKIVDQQINKQTRIITRGDVGTVEETVPGEKEKAIKLSSDKAEELAKMCIKIEKHYGRPQDIEWAIDTSGKIWILQSRPITTL